MKRGVIFSITFFYYILIGYAEPQPFIFALKTSSNPFYDGIYESFKKECNCIIEIYDIKGDVETGKRIIKENFSRIEKIGLAIGTQAMRSFYEQYPELPVLYLLSIGPEYLGIKDTKIFGISTFFYPEEVSKLFSEVFPDIHSVGILLSDKLTGIGNEMKEAFSKS